MLTALRISGFALIDEVELELGPGFRVCMPNKDEPSKNETVPVGLVPAVFCTVALSASVLLGK